MQILGFLILCVLYMVCISSKPTDLPWLKGYWKFLNFNFNFSLILRFHNLLHSSQQDLITLQRNFEVVSNLADDLKNEKNSLKDKLELLRQEGHANNASLNRQRELLHQDRLAFTHQRIAFDNHTMVGFSKILSKNYESLIWAYGLFFVKLSFWNPKQLEFRTF